MQKKIDKEYLIKNRFWVSLPVICLFLLIGFFCVMGVRGTAEANFQKATATNTKLDTVKKDPDNRNNNWNGRMETEKNLAKDHMMGIWKQEFDRQNGVFQVGQERKIGDPLITWPKAVEDRLVGKSKRPLNAHDFGEPVGDSPPYYNELPFEYAAAYRDQFDEIRYSLDLLDEKTGKGSVRVKGTNKTNWENALDMLRPQKLTPNKKVTSEEAWLLQEDMAIKRELCKAITNANDLIANLQPEWRLITTLPDALKSAKSANEPATPGAGASPSTPPSSGTPAAGAEKSDKPEDAKKEKGKTINHQHFLNTTWQIGLIEREVDKDGKPTKAPSTDWWEGWLMDVELYEQGSDFAVQALVANLGNLHKTPATKLSIVLYDEFASVKEFPLIVDVPELVPTKNETTRALYDAQQKGELDFDKVAAMPISKQMLKIDLKGKLPDKYRPKKIVQVRRAPPPQTAKGDDKTQIWDHQRFTNDFWVLDVQLTSGSAGFSRTLQGTLYNRSLHRMIAPHFMVSIVDDSGNDYKQEIPIRADKLNALNTGGSAHKDRLAFPKPGDPAIKVERQNRYREITSVRQVLDWQTVPIKRIDDLDFGTRAIKENDRVKIVPLVKYDFNRKTSIPQPQEEAATPGGGAPGGGPSLQGAGPGGMSMSGSGMNPGGMGGGEKKDLVTPNHGVPRYRYYETATEVRRVPVALVLIVDANHVADVLTAFANTRLRVQVTQAVWTRMAQGIPRPPIPGSSTPPASSGSAAGGPGLAMGGGGGASKGAANIPAANKPVDDDTLQVELQVYGLATIYEDPVAYERIEKEKREAPAK